MKEVFGVRQGREKEAPWEVEREREGIGRIEREGSLSPRWNNAKDRL